MNESDLKAKVEKLVGAHQKVVAGYEAEITRLRKENESLASKKVASDGLVDIRGISSKIAEDLAGKGYLDPSRKEAFIESVVAAPESLVDVCSKIASFGEPATDFANTGSLASGDEPMSVGEKIDKAWSKLGKFVQA